MSNTYYYNHTSKLPAVQMGYLPMASLAITMDGDKLKYGIAICHNQDNFSRKAGRAIAQARAENGFGVMPIPTADLIAKKDYTYEEWQKHVCLKALYNLTESLLLKSRKWRKRLEKWNKTGNAESIGQFLNQGKRGSTTVPVVAMYTNKGV